MWCRAKGVFTSIAKHVNLSFMFARKKRNNSNPHIYVQLVENWRDEESKTRQRVVKHIGTAINEEQLEQLMKVADKVKLMYEDYEEEKDIDLFIKREVDRIHGSGTDILNCQPIKKVTYGVHDIYGKIFDDIGLGTLICSKSNYGTVLKDLVMSRIAIPSSKRRSCEILENDFGIVHDLNKIYRMMDKIDNELIAKIQNQIAGYTKGLLNEELKVLFYDATTIYFESFTDDELKKLGYSKDCKFNQPQLVLTLLVTKSGLPLGYQLFPGNTYEGNTLISAINNWMVLYPNNSFVLVADSGMLNEINISFLERKNISYIVCARIKNLPEQIKKDILCGKNNYEQEFFHDFKFKERRLVVSYKINRATKDRMDREKSLVKIKNKLSKSTNPLNLVNNYGYKKIYGAEVAKS